MSTNKPKGKIVFHDYGGHAFTAQIARELAGRGLETVYLSFSGFATPKGRVTRNDSDPTTFSTQQIDISNPFEKDNLWKRSRQQAEYGRLVAKWVVRERPGIVISSNCPLEVQKAMLAACRRVGARFIFWLQDVHAEAIGRILSRKNRFVGKIAGAYYQRLEARLLSDSDAVIAIAEEFVELMEGWGVRTDHVVTIENWAPIADLPQFPRDNPVAAKFFRAGRQRIVYSGTLARKHNPDLLLDLGRALDVDIHLFSEGRAADYVRNRARDEDINNIFVHGWVPVDHLPQMLSGADILCAFIEADAGKFSVPSKVLSYLSIGRPILASIPGNNLAARTIRTAKAGLVSDVHDPQSFVADARTLLEDATLGREMGANGRAYAERVFDIGRIGDKFMACIDSLIDPTRDRDTANV